MCGRQQSAATFGYTTHQTPPQTHTSVFHGFVGGKSLGDSRFLPSPRAILLCLTLLLNMYGRLRTYLCMILVDILD